MSKVEEHKKHLLSNSDQELYLRENSCLPGPRSNLELLYAFIEVSEIAFTKHLLQKPFSILPENNPEEFVQCCAVASLGKHILNGNDEFIFRLKEFACDSRWRIRESAAMALQHIGKYNTENLIAVTAGWEKGSHYLQRALAAGLCEPQILKSTELKEYALNSLETITKALPVNNNPSSVEYKALIKGLSYCWSVAIVAYPEKGKPLFEELTNLNNKDVKKIIKENLKKNRLIKSHPMWVEQMLAHIA